MRRECFCCRNDWPEEVMHYKDFKDFDIQMWICPNCEQAANIIKKNLVKMATSGQVGMKLVEIERNGDVECDCPDCRAEREEEKCITPTPKAKGKPIKIQWDN